MYVVYLFCLRYLNQLKPSSLGTENNGPLGTCSRQRLTRRELVFPDIPAHSPPRVSEGYLSLCACLDDRPQETSVIELACVAKAIACRRFDVGSNAPKRLSFRNTREHD